VSWKGKAKVLGRNRVQIEALFGRVFNCRCVVHFGVR